MKSRLQRGFTLLELSITLAVIGLATVATIQLRLAETRADSAKAAAQVYQRLNNAAGSYMTLYYKELLAKNEPECGVLRYKLGVYVGRGDVPPDCKITLDEKPIKNYLQPTVEELASLNLLTGGVSNRLPFKTYTDTGNSELIAYDRGANPAPDGFGILVQLMCINVNPTIPDPIVSKNNNCTSNSYDLRSLVFNLQPYFAGDADQRLVLYQVQQAAGGGSTFISDERSDGKLKAFSNATENTLSNPLVKSSFPTIGAPFIIAMRNGYGSSGWDSYVRRDGSTTLKGDWNVGGKSITGIDNLSTNSAEVSGELNAGSVATGSVSAGSVSATGTVKGGDGVFGNFLGNFKAALNATTAYFSDSLTVAQTTRLSGDTYLDGKTMAAKIRLTSEAALGDACVASDETLRRSTTNGSVLLLVCDPTSKTWVRSQEDYRGEIDNIYVAIKDLGGSVTNINNSLASVGGSVISVEKRLAKVEDDYILNP